MTIVNDFSILKSVQEVRVLGKRQEGAKKTRQSLIQAAKVLHDQKGLANVSVDEIVALAGVSKGSFYVYFKRKEDIAAEIAFNPFVELIQSLDTSSHSALEKLCCFLIESVQLIEEQGLSMCQEWMKSAVSPISENTPGMIKLNLDRNYVLATLQLAKQNQEIEGNTSLDPLVDMIMAQYYGAVALWSLTNGKFSMVEDIQEFTKRLKTLLK